MKKTPCRIHNLFLHSYDRMNTRLSLPFVILSCVLLKILMTI